MQTTSVLNSMACPMYIYKYVHGYFVGISSLQRAKKQIMNSARDHESGCESCIMSNHCEMRSGMRDMVDRSQVSSYLLLVCPDDAEEVACWTGDHTSSVRTASTCHSSSLGPPTKSAAERQSSPGRRGTWPGARSALSVCVPTHKRDTQQAEPPAEHHDKQACRWKYTGQKTAVCR